jgi:hypothetical protein
MRVPAIIAIEAELADSRTMFRLNGRVIAEHSTAAQAHLLVGDALERIVLPTPPSQAQAALARAYAVAEGRA